MPFYYATVTFAVLSPTSIGPIKSINDVITAMQVQKSVGRFVAVNEAQITPAQAKTTAIDFTNVPVSWGL